MAKPLSVLFCASEVFPFAKTGGLADVAYGLPLALRDLGHDIRVMLPKYGMISERKNRIHEINRLKDIPIPVGSETEHATVKSSSVTNPRTKVQAYMTTNHTYFDSKWGLYTDPDTGEAYADNAERFIFFCRTVLDTCHLLGWYPDIVHCNDWHTAIIPALMRTEYAKPFKNTKIVYTIHNIENQGEFPLKSTFEKTGLDEELLSVFKHKNKFNFLKGGLHFADHITTVSPAYGKQILSDTKMTNGLSTELKKRKDTFTPILNGIDQHTWNPAKDKLIKKKFSADKLDLKEDNKEAMLNEFGLSSEDGVPALAMISRLVEHKGLGLVVEAAEKLLEKDVQLVILGEGNPSFEKALKDLAAEYPDKVGVEIGFNEQLAHLMEAGADMFLMPSLHEPCGLNQMYSLAYGTVPIVRATGGLGDTISEFDVDSGEGLGFRFDDYTADAMMAAIEKAMEVYTNKEAWEKLQVNGMEKDYTWLRSAAEYEEVYRNL